jgi:hypothetical protein
VRQDLWRASHAHAGVYLILALVILRYVDEARLPDWLKLFVRFAAPLLRSSCRQASSCRSYRLRRRVRMPS